MIKYIHLLELFVYLILSFVLFSFIIISHENIIYYKCSISTKYYTHEEVIPLCSVDIKYKMIKLYGYFTTANSSNYYYNVIPLHLENNRYSYIYSMFNISITKILTTKSRISLCLVSIYSNLNIVNVVRTCLMYRKLGVEHVTLYISFYDKKYKKYYTWFSTRKWIEIIYFKLPNISTYLYGQELKLNHCINHYRYISDYVVVTDVDEIILPVKRVYILDILAKYGKNNFVFSFKSVLFRVNNIKSSVFFTSKIGCMIENGYEKMILKPEKILSIGAHFPKLWQETGRIIYISTNDAYVRHARIKGGMKQLTTLNCNRIKESKYLSYLINTIEHYIKLI